jgi:phthiocerol/phenolphthiocerol synthesis type-I polyketide synthase D
MSDIEAALRVRIKTTLAQFVPLPIQGLDESRDFTEYGLGSAEAALFIGALEDVLGRELSPLLVYDHPTIASLAAALAGESEVEHDGQRI